MEPTLYFHPLASYRWKALIALYDSGIAFTPRVVDLGKADDRAALPALFYASILEPILDGLGVLHAYFERLLLRPAVRRVLEEAGQRMEPPGTPRSAARRQNRPRSVSTALRGSP